MVNAVLRRAQREGLPQAGSETAWPAWLAQRIRDDWPGQDEAIFAASAQEAPMWLRVNRRLHARDAYAGLLQDAGIVSHVVPSLADALRLDTALPVHELPGFDAGCLLYTSRCV